MTVRNLERDANYFNSFIADWLGLMVTNPYDLPFSKGPNLYDWETANKHAEEAKKAEKVKQAEIQEVYNKLAPVAKREHFIEKKEDKYIISIPLPGVKKEEVELSYTIEAKDRTSTLKVTVADKDRGILAVKSYSQSFSFSKGTLDASNIAAKCDEGYLVIEIPYARTYASQQPESIKVL